MRLGRSHRVATSARPSIRPAGGRGLGAISCLLAALAMLEGLFFQVGAPAGDHEFTGASSPCETAAAFNPGVARLEGSR